MRHHRWRALRYCQSHRRATTGRWRAQPCTGSVVSMFLPQDLTTTEQELVASITSQLLAGRSPSTAAEETTVRHEAAQVAAEMIWEARRQDQMSDEYDDQE